MRSSYTVYGYFFTRKNSGEKTPPVGSVFVTLIPVAYSSTPMPLINADRSVPTSL